MMIGRLLCWLGRHDFLVYPMLFHEFDYSANRHRTWTRRDSYCSRCHVPLDKSNPFPSPASPEKPT